MLAHLLFECRILCANIAKNLVLAYHRYVREGENFFILKEDLAPGFHPDLDLLNPLYR